MGLTLTSQTKGTVQQERDEVNLLYFFIITHANKIKALQDEEPDQDADCVYFLSLPFPLTIENQLSLKEKKKCKIFTLLIVTWKM